MVSYEDGGVLLLLVSINIFGGQFELEPAKSTYDDRNNQTNLAQLCVNTEDSTKHHCSVERSNFSDLFSGSIEFVALSWRHQRDLECNYEAQTIRNYQEFFVHNREHCIKLSIHPLDRLNLSYSILLASSHLAPFNFRLLASISLPYFHLHLLQSFVLLHNVDLDR